MSEPPSSEPQSLSSGGPIPSSFDGSDFFEESRATKFFRKLRQEPLIPLGCAATCYALYQAAKSIRLGTPYQTNRMFRARIYAQGFTLVAIVAGSIFYKDERMKRKAMETKVEEKKAMEKREKWLRELEMRDEEDKEWRRRIERENATATAELKEVPISGAKAQRQQGPNGRFQTKSVSEDVRRNGLGEGWWWARTREVWRRS